MIDISDEIKGSVDYKWKQLREEGPQIPGVSDSFDPNQVPKWLEPQRLLEAQKTVQDCFYCLYFSHFCGLLLVVQLPYGLIPLLATGRSQSVACLFQRYISTLHHVLLWYQSDLLDPNSEGSRSLGQVRAMHKKVGEKLNDNNKSKRLWVSQYDMVATQWAFVGLIVLYPEKCGLHSPSRQQLEDIIYFWRAIGFFIGIEDRFNLCSGNFEETYYLSALFRDDEYRPVLSAKPHPAPLGLEMATDIVKGFSVFFNGTRVEVFLKYWYQILDIDVSLPFNGMWDTFHFFMLKFVMNFALVVPFIRMLFGNFLKKQIMRVGSKRGQIELSLKKKYEVTNDNNKCTKKATEDFQYIDYFETMSRGTHVSHVD